MKNLFLFLLFSCLSFSSFSQNMMHTFILKDGTRFEVEIIEKLDNGDYRVKTVSGNEMLIEHAKIQSVVLDEPDIDVDDYGSQSAFGLSLFGGNEFFGFHFRREMAKELFLDLGGHITPNILVNNLNDEIEFAPAITTSGGVDYFLKRFYKAKKDRVRGNGIFLQRLPYIWRH